MLSFLLLPTALAVPPTVLLDPGHGAPGNPGNTGATCRTEAAEMLRVATALEARLIDRWTMRSTRPGGAETPYGDRVRDAAGADVFLSLHSDARGEGRIPVGEACPQSLGHPGFTILVSDEPDDRADRARLAVALAEAMVAEGFVPYDGREYRAAYDAHEVPGVFLDRRGLRMLRRPTMPSVIIETHHAWDPTEVASWQTAETLDRFARAVDRGLQEYFRTRPPADPGTATPAAPPSE